MSDDFNTTVLAMLAAVQDGQVGVHRLVVGLDHKVTALDSRVSGLETEIVSVRTAIMERLDRLQHRMDILDEHRRSEKGMPIRSRAASRRS